MNSQSCVICRNEKPVNSTDNRLVTESCGHVKCMDCLMREKSGCVACSAEKTKTKFKEDTVATESLPEPKDKPQNVTHKEIQCEPDYDFYKKKKPETSHIKIETDANGRTYECTVCNKKFHARSQVAYHAYCNGQRKPYQCPECNKSFATHSHYKYHMRVHRNERTYTCDDCGDAFFQMSKLQRHKLKHTKEKKYACSECNKAFNNMTALRNHGLLHTQERPHACAVCGRRFRDSSNYRKHVAKHEKKCSSCPGGYGGCGGCGARGGCGAGARRRHQCPRCPQAFHSGKDMRRHAVVHTDSKPFRCKVCNRRFRRKDNLERHVRNTHPDYVPSTAVECDEQALKVITADGPPPSKPEVLKILNPLPPLPQEVIQKHLNEKEPTKEEIDKKQSIKNTDVIDTSYILVANNARESVIVEKRPIVEIKPTSPVECEYVHKIRKASIISLPPIDLRKIIELEEHSNRNNLHVHPTKDKKTLYEKILYGDGDKKDHEEGNVDAGAGVHWRRKLKQSVPIDLK